MHIHMLSQKRNQAYSIESFQCACSHPIYLSAVFRPNLLALTNTHHPSSRQHQHPRSLASPILTQRFTNIPIEPMHARTQTRMHTEG